MTTFLHVALANLAVASILAVLAIVVGRFCRRPALVHSLWLLVLLKLVTPPLVQLPVIPGLDTPAVEERETADPQDEIAARVETVPDAPPIVGVPVLPPKTTVLVEMGPGLLIEPRSGVIARDPMQFVERTTETLPPGIIDELPNQPDVLPLPSMEAPPPEPKKATVPAPPSVRWDGRTVLLAAGWLWVAGAAAWFAWAAICLLRFGRMLRHAIPAPAELQEETRRIAVSLGLRRCPSVWLVPGALPPMVWSALGRARLLFPIGLLDRLDDEGRASLLTHELAHLRRRDHWVRWLELVVVGLYWWCPLVWLARRRLQQSEEECCDAWVVGELPPRAYAGAILEALDFLAGASTTLPAVASGLGRLGAIKRRLTSIMQRSTPKRLS